MPDAPTEIDELVAAQTALMDAQARLATAMEVANAIGAPLVQQQTDLIAEFQAAQAALLAAQANEAETYRLLTEIAGNTLATETAIKTLDMQIDEMKFTAQLSVSATVDAIVNAKIPQDLKLLALGSTDAISKTINAIVTGTLPNDLKLLALGNTTAISKAINMTVTGTLPPDLRALALDQIGAVTKQVQAIVTGTLSADIQALALGQTDALTKAIALTTTFAHTLTAEQRAALLEQGTTVYKSINAALTGGTMTADQKALLAEQGGSLSKLVSAAVTGSLTPDQRLILDTLTSANVSLAPALSLNQVLRFDENDPLKSIWTGILNSVLWLDDIHHVLLFVANNTNKAAQVVDRTWNNPVTLFATGGAFTNGIVTRPTAFSMGLMGEAGPEAIMPLTNVNGSLGVRVTGGRDDGALIAELQALRNEVQALRSEARATAINTGRTQDLMKRVTRNGEAMQTEAST